MTDVHGHFLPREGMVLADSYTVTEKVEPKRSNQSAVIVKAHSGVHNAEVVIKVFHKHYHDIGKQEGGILQQIMKADPHGHARTVRLLDQFSFEDHYCLVFEALDPTSLQEALYRRLLSQENTESDRTVGDEKVLKALRKVSIYLLQCLGFLRKQHIIHADLKPENILMDDTGKPSSLRVIDFGNAIRSNDPDHMEPYLKTFHLQPLIYRAPEVIFGMLFSTQVDVWSLGCVLAGIYLRRPLFVGNMPDNQDPQKAVENLLKSMVGALGPLPLSSFCHGKFCVKYRQFTTDDPVNAEDNLFAHLRNVRGGVEPDGDFVSFLSGLLTYNPCERLTPVEAAQHPFLASEICLSYLMPETATEIPSTARHLVSPPQQKQHNMSTISSRFVSNSQYHQDGRHLQNYQKSSNSVLVLNENDQQVIQQNENVDLNDHDEQVIEQTENVETAASHIDSTGYHSLSDSNIPVDSTSCDDQVENHDISAKSAGLTVDDGKMDHDGDALLLSDAENFHASELIPCDATESGKNVGATPFCNEDALSTSNAENFHASEESCHASEESCHASEENFHASELISHDVRDADATPLCKSENSHNLSKVQLDLAASHEKSFGDTNTNSVHLCDSTNSSSSSDAQLNLLAVCDRTVEHDADDSKASTDNSLDASVHEQDANSDKESFEIAQQNVELLTVCDRTVEHSSDDDRPSSANSLNASVHEKDANSENVNFGNAQQNVKLLTVCDHTEHSADDSKASSDNNNCVDASMHEKDANIDCENFDNTPQNVVKLGGTSPRMMNVSFESHLGYGHFKTIKVEQTERTFEEANDHALRSDNSHGHFKMVKVEQTERTVKVADDYAASSNDDASLGKLAFSATEMLTRTTESMPNIDSRIPSVGLTNISPAQDCDSESSSELDGVLCISDASSDENDIGDAERKHFCASVTASLSSETPKPHVPEPSMHQRDNESPVVAHDGFQEKSEIETDAGNSNSELWKTVSEAKDRVSRLRADNESSFSNGESWFADVDHIKNELVQAVILSLEELTPVDPCTKSGDMKTMFENDIEMDANLLLLKDFHLKVEGDRDDQHTETLFENQKDTELSDCHEIDISSLLLLKDFHEVGEGEKPTETLFENDTESYENRLNESDLSLLKDFHLNVEEDREEKKHSEIVFDQDIEIFKNSEIGDLSLLKDFHLNPRVGGEVKRHSETLLENDSETSDNIVIASDLSSLKGFRLNTKVDSSSDATVNMKSKVKTEATEADNVVSINHEGFTFSIAIDGRKEQSVVSPKMFTHVKSTDCQSNNNPVKKEVEEDEKEQEITTQEEELEKTKVEGERLTEEEADGYGELENSDVTIADQLPQSRRRHRGMFVRDPQSSKLNQSASSKMKSKTEREKKAQTRRNENELKKLVSRMDSYEMEACQVSPRKAKNKAINTLTHTEHSSPATGRYSVVDRLQYAHGVTSSPKKSLASASTAPTPRSNRKRKLELHPTIPASPRKLRAPETTTGEEKSTPNQSRRVKKVLNVKTPSSCHDTTQVQHTATSIKTESSEQSSPSKSKSVKKTPGCSAQEQEPEQGAKKRKQCSKSSVQSSDKWMPSKSKSMKNTQECSSQESDCVAKKRRRRSGKSSVQSSDKLTPSKSKSVKNILDHVAKKRKRQCSKSSVQLQSSDKLTPNKSKSVKNTPECSDQESDHVGKKRRQCAKSPVDASNKTGRKRRTSKKGTGERQNIQVTVNIVFMNPSPGGGEEENDDEVLLLE